MNELHYYCTIIIELPELNLNGVSPCTIIIEKSEHLIYCYNHYKEKGSSTRMTVHDRVLLLQKGPNTSLNSVSLCINIIEGPEHQDELEVDGVPPYEDRLGPDGAEGENPVLPQVRSEE